MLKNTKTLPLAVSEDDFALLNKIKMMVPIFPPSTSELARGLLRAAGMMVVEGSVSLETISRWSYAEALLPIGTIGEVRV